MTAQEVTNDICRVSFTKEEVAFLYGCVLWNKECNYHVLSANREKAASITGALGEKLATVLTGPER